MNHRLKIILKSFLLIAASMCIISGIGYAISKFITQDTYSHLVRSGIDKKLHIAISGRIKPKIFRFMIKAENVEIGIPQDSDNSYVVGHFIKCKIYFSPWYALIMKPKITRVVLYRARITLNRQSLMNIDIGALRRISNANIHINRLSLKIGKASYIAQKMDISSQKISTSIYDGHGQVYDITNFVKSSKEHTEIKYKGGQIVVDYNKNGGAIVAQGDNISIPLHNILQYIPYNAQTKSTFKFKCEWNKKDGSINVRKISLHNDIFAFKGNLNISKYHRVSANLSVSNLHILDNKFQHLDITNDIFHGMLSHAIPHDVYGDIDITDVHNDSAPKVDVDIHIKKGGIMNIQQFRISNAHNHFIDVKGIVSSNAYRSRFDGLMQLKYGKNRSFRANTIITPMAMILSKIESYNGNTQYFGEIYKQIFSNRRFYHGFLNIRNESISNHNVVKIYNSLLNHTRNSGYKTQCDIRVMCNRCSLNHESTNTISTSITSHGRSIKIKDFKIISPTTNVSGHASINDAKILSFNFNIKGSKLNTNIMNLPPTLIETTNGLRWNTAKILNRNTALNNAKLNAKISIGDVTSIYGQVSDFNTKIDFSNNVLTIDRFKGKTKYGDFSTYGSISMRDNISATLTAQINNNKLSRITDIMHFPISNGYFSFSSYFRASGNSMMELARDIDGTAKFAAKSFDIKGIDVNKFIYKLPRARNDSDIISLATNGIKGENTHIGEIIGSVNIKSGIASGSSQFYNKRFSGVSSYSANVSNFGINSVHKIFFFPVLKDDTIGKRTSFEAFVKGSLYQPIISFKDQDLKNAFLFNQAQ